MTCNICKLEFNELDNVLKILPCFSLSCLKCLNTFPCIQNETLVNCRSCSKTHFITNVNDLPTNEIKLDILPSVNKKNDLEEFQEELKTYLRSENYEIYKHYDDVIYEIDIKAETLIQFIKKNCEMLQKQVIDHQNKAMYLFKDEPLQDEKIDTETLKMLSIKDRLIKLGEKKPENIAELQLIIQEANCMQRYIEELNKNIIYFSESSTKFEKSILGFNLNSLFDRNFLKIANLKQNFENISNSRKVHFETKCDDSALRKEVFALENNYIVFYFTCKRTIVLESFDFQGKLIKSSEPFSSLTSFPVSSRFGNHFVLSFSTSGTHSVHLLDSDLNEVCSMITKNYVESLYLNTTHLLVTYDRNKGCVELYNFDFKKLDCFGQNTNSELEFYLEKSVGPSEKNKKFGQKCNPSIFGMTDKYFYMNNCNKVSILDRASGKEVKKIELKGYRPYFMMDMQQNIIEVNILEKRIAIYTSFLDILAESIYNDEYEYVYVTPANNLMFLDVEKKNLSLI